MSLSEGRKAVGDIAGKYEEVIEEEIQAINLSVKNRLHQDPDI